jgi:hypothetical protein
MLYERGGFWRLGFSYRGRQHFLSFGRVTPAEAEARAAEATELLRRVRSGELELPDGMNIATFLTFGGVVPGDYRRPGEGGEQEGRRQAERAAVGPHRCRAEWVEDPRDWSIRWECLLCGKPMEPPDGFRR